MLSSAKADYTANIPSHTNISTDTYITYVNVLV